MTEIWKDIPNFNHVYQASSQGRVRSTFHKVVSHARGRRLYYQSYKGQMMSINHSAKHPTVGLRRGEANHYPIKNIIALTFIPNPHGYKHVIHRDGNLANNRVANLKWCSGKRFFKITHSKNGIGRKQKPIGLWNGHEIHIFPTVKDSALWIISKRYAKTANVGSVRATLSQVVNNHRNTAYGYKVRYVDTNDISDLRGVHE